jgi:predicted TIM-barrel fold metal-dependent hydrolase
VSRLWGEDASLLAQAGAPVEDLERLERALEASLELPAGGRWDAHVHLGRDADGHRLAPEDLVADLDRWDLAGAVCFPPNDPGPDGRFTGANGAVLAAAAAWPERIVPFCRLDPCRAWDDDLERSAAGGARGLKLHPVAQRFAPDAPECVALVRAAAERGWPVLIHAGYGARPVAASIAALADAAPGARLILAHGARGDARAAAALAERPGIAFDTSLATLADLTGLPPARLCLGSDRPYGEHGSALQLVALAAAVAGWSDEDVRGVLGGNLRAMLAG